MLVSVSLDASYYCDEGRSRELCLFVTPTADRLASCLASSQPARLQHGGPLSAKDTNQELELKSP
jgi:hypothetical protein